MAGTRRPVYPGAGEHRNMHTEQEASVSIVEPGTAASQSTRRITRSRAVGGVARGQ